MPSYYSPYLAHYGVKGMKWGIRKKRQPYGTTGTKLNTSRGKTAYLTKDKPSLIVKGLQAVSKNARNLTKLTHNYDIYDERGKRVGDLQTFDESKDSVNVTWIGVNTKARGHGYASAALDQAIKQAKKDGKKQMTLEVPGNSPDALHIYEKKGFKKGKVISSSDDIWEGLTAMRLDLTK